MLQSQKARRSPRILVAEGKKESAILEAEAEKQAAILRAEAEKEKRIRSARQKVRLKQYVSYSRQMQKVFRYLKEAGADQAVLTIKSLEAFEKAARRPGNQDYHSI